MVIMIRLFEVKLKVGQREDCLKEAVFKKLGKFSSFIDESSIIISGKSIDARDKNNIWFIYNVDFELKSKDKNSESSFITKLQKFNKKIKIKTVEENIYNPQIISLDNSTNSTDKNIMEKDSSRPVVVGFGPAGMFAALLLAQNGLRPIVIERGKPVEERVKDVAKFWKDGVFNADSNPLFGEGGAGTFSDGKLTTGKNDPRIPFILKSFYDAGAPKEILYAKNPHIGTDVLRVVVKSIRKQIIKLGGEIRFDSTFVGFETTENNAAKNENLKNLNSSNDEVYPKNRVCSITIKNNITNEKDKIKTNNLILAIGHSARDTYKVLLAQGMAMEQKPFSIGLRIEHEQSLIDSSQYGAKFQDIYNMSMNDAEMPPAEYKLSHKLQNGRGVYTFCMCPGGDVITTSAEEGTISVNGMSNQKRDGKYANSALLVDVRTEDYVSDEPLAGVDFQREYERRAFVAGGSNYRAPIETVAQFMGEQSQVGKCLPDFVVSGIREALPVFGRKIRGFDNPDAIVKGIESSSSSPVRINRNKELVSNISGIYPCGEGAGFAGGITSSAIDGLKCAETICHKY